MNDTYISVWYDDASDLSEKQRWIVDRCDDDGNSTTVWFFYTEYNARKFAKQYSQKTGLPIRD